MNETFGEAIRQARKQKGYTLRTLASKVGMSHPYLSQLEKGHNTKPSLEIILNLSRELDLPLAYLINLSDIDIGIKHEFSPEILNVLKTIRTSDYEGWDTYEDFLKVFAEKNYIPYDLNDATEISKHEKFLKNFYKIMLAYRKLERNTMDTLIAKQAIEISTTDSSDISRVKFEEWRSIDNYNNNKPIAIYLNPDNEGNFYFFKEGVEIPEEMQKKLRHIIKTMLD